MKQKITAYFAPPLRALRFMDESYYWCQRALELLGIGQKLRIETSFSLSREKSKPRVTSWVPEL